ncbi:hypothetical protein F5X68DRAFT_33924 [Plectosphaerella plurivora]|uniref:GEgh 16 protein n=1 Tax=Plectosphaerella plurivora TaxID=936078 RepID=A0A9P8V7L8_9PEZI|nr:hypothetical protein F5X68DRAFT_33924 [Plectosphaerella plurivora]
MISVSNFLAASAVLAVAHGHGVIIGAQGAAGSPASVGFLVNPELARNCTTISPCQQDATLIRDAEIEANIVNECGRTELSGNIDIGEQTENALVANAVTSVTKGSTVEITVHQVNADGAGPYFCDLDTTGNARRLVGQVPLNITNNVPGVNGFSQAKAQQFTMTVTLPADMECTGSSAGNVCTVRCRNNALAGPFGGCFPVQQTDVTPKVNRPDNIDTAQALDLTLAQVAANQKDLPAAIQANANAGADGAKQNLAAVEAILKINPATSAFPQQTPDLLPPGGAAGGAADAASSTVPEATATPTADAGNNAGAGGNAGGNAGNGNGRNRGNANAGNGRNGAGAGAGAADGAATGRNGAGNGGNGNGRNGGNNQQQGQNQGNNNNNQKRSMLRWANRLA